MTEHKMNNQYFSVAPSTDGLGVERFRTEKDGFTVDIFDRKENVNLEERFLLRISEGEKHIGSGTIKSREDVSDLVDKILSSITSKATTSPQGTSDRIGIKMRQKTIKQESKKITEFTYHTRSGIYSHMKNGWLSEEEIQMEVSSINKACLKSTGKRASKIIVHKTGGKEKPIPIVAYERIAENLEDFEALVKSTLKSSGLDKFVDISIFQHSKTAFLNVPSCEIFEISASPMRSGYGSRVLDLVARYADLGNIPLWLSVANESDDPFDFDDDDPEAPPSEDDLIRLYGKFGFRVVVSGSRTIMVRHPNAEN